VAADKYKGGGNGGKAAKKYTANSTSTANYRKRLQKSNAKKPLQTAQNHTNQAQTNSNLHTTLINTKNLI